MTAHRSPVDQLMAPAALEAFAERRALIHEAVQQFGFRPGNAVMFGGGGFAAHNVDTHVGPNAFDADVAVDNTLYSHLTTLWYKSHPLVFRGPAADHLKFKTVGGLPVTVLCSPLSDRLAHGLGVSYFHDLVLRTEVYGGVPTLSMPDLVRSKLARGLVRDVAGILKGQIVAWGTDNPITKNKEWEEAVRRGRPCCAVMAESCKLAARQS